MGQYTDTVGKLPRLTIQKFFRREVFEAHEGCDGP
jgi:hypothetical protein